jgi:hypothetical protein
MGYEPTPEHRAKLSASIKQTIESKVAQGLPANGHAAKTRCPEGHRYSGKNKYGHRICRICTRRQQKEWRERKAKGRNGMVDNRNETLRRLFDETR